MLAELPLLRSSPSVQGIQIKLFAQLREEAGWDQRWLAIDPENQATITPEVMWGCIGRTVPLSSLRIAINQQFAAADTPLHPGDELAFLPPICGG